MDEKMKTTLLVVACIIIIAISFIGMQYVRTAYTKQTIEFNNVSFQSPVGYKYVNGSYTILNNDSGNETTYRISLQNGKNEIIEIKQHNTAFILVGDTAQINGIAIYKNNSISDYNQYTFNFDGKGYDITTPAGNDQLITDIVESLEVL